MVSADRSAAFTWWTAPPPLIPIRSRTTERQHVRRRGDRPGQDAYRPVGGAPGDTDGDGAVINNLGATGSTLKVENTNADGATPWSSSTTNAWKRDCPHRMIMPGGLHHGRRSGENGVTFIKQNTGKLTVNGL
ncbi:MAG: hypothetical protein ACLT8E_09245 [Akkermansia sp.]